MWRDMLSSMTDNLRVYLQPSVIPWELSFYYMTDVFIMIVFVVVISDLR